eukprot:5970998-Pyramimonas_sp.AAC.1
MRGRAASLTRTTARALAPSRSTATAIARRHARRSPTGDPLNRLIQPSTPARGMSERSAGDVPTNRPDGPDDVRDACAGPADGGGAAHLGEGPP